MPRNTGVLVPALFLLLSTAGAAGHAAATDTPLRDNVRVTDVSGGDTTNPLWESALGNDEFRRALKHLMDLTGLLERARGEGRYSLSAALESCNQSDVGYTVTTRVTYSLTDTRTGTEVYRESIVSDYGNSVWDSLMRSKKSLTISSFRANIGILTGKLFQVRLLQEEASLQQ